MAKPTKPTPPDRALRSNPSTFSANAEAWITYQWGTFPDYIDNTADFVDEQANAALAAALGGDLPVITGQALKLLRVNAGETAAEFVDPATVVLAEAPELSQVQVENPASTVFGQVSGERLGQAAEAKIVDRFNLTGTAPTYACRAWVNFNGTGTPSIRAAGNVSSITDIATGRYRVNFAVAMPDADYAVVALGDTAAGGGSSTNFASIDGGGTYSASAVDISCKDADEAITRDTNIMAVAVFR